MIENTTSGPRYQRVQNQQGVCKKCVAEEGFFDDLTISEVPLSISEVPLDGLEEVGNSLGDIAD